MKRLFSILLFSFVVLSFNRPAQAVVEVAFIDPADYTDSAIKGGPFGSGSMGVLNALRGYLMDLGNANLSPSDGVRIEVLDVDLAGRYEWWRFPFDKRVMKESSAPAIEVKYTFYVDGKKVDENEERITDANYLQNADADSAGGALKYEKIMLDRWFRDRFVNHKPASN